MFKLYIRVCEYFCMNMQSLARSMLATGPEAKITKTKYQISGYTLDKDSDKEYT